MIEFIVFIVLLTLGYTFGVWTENRHYRSIIAREKMLSRVPAIATKHIPVLQPAPDTCLVSGNVVVSVDYFKRFIATLRNFFGGRLTSYETLLDRGRREAILRMKAEAAQRGASSVFNVKIETSSVSKGAGNSVGSIEILAYGTALIPAQERSSFGAMTHRSM